MPVSVTCLETKHEFGSHSYLITYNDRAILIDVGDDYRNIKPALKGYQLKAVLLTHGHYDHFIGLADLLKEHPVRVFISSKDYSKLKSPKSNCSRLLGTDYRLELSDVLLIKDSLHIEFGFDSLVEAIATPGHTDGSLTYLIEDKLFVGDTIFYHGVGRTDLPTGNIRQLMESLKKLLSFPTDYQIYPGHDRMTSVGEEIKRNRHFQK